MKNYNIHLYTIECLTNLHAGSGNDNFGVIDKEVQRDPVDGVPIIHSSSLKGAIREYFEEVVKVPGIVSKYFGSGKGDKTLQQGSLRFFEARLMAIPVRGNGNEAYYMASTKNLLEQLNSAIAITNPIVASVPVPVTTNAVAKTEHGEVPLLVSIPIVGNGIAFFETMNQKTVLNSLPIIARNSLENGQSDNLWYEEIIPRGSKFYFLIAVPDSEVNYKTEFEDFLTKDLIQIGANATIGYGYCKILKN